MLSGRRHESAQPFEHFVTATFAAAAPRQRGWKRGRPTMCKLDMSERVCRTQQCAQSCEWMGAIDMSSGAQAQLTRAASAPAALANCVERIDGQNYRYRSMMRRALRRIRSRPGTIRRAKQPAHRRCARFDAFAGRNRDDRNRHLVDPDGDRTAIRRPAIKIADPATSALAEHALELRLIIKCDPRHNEPSTLAPLDTRLLGEGRSRSAAPAHRFAARCHI